MSKDKNIRVVEGGVPEMDYPFDNVNGIVISRDLELSVLVGKLLTYIDATYTDLDQRKAHKRILKETVYTWYYDNFDGQHSEKSLRGWSREMSE